MAFIASCDAVFLLTSSAPDIKAFIIVIWQQLEIAFKGIIQIL